MINLHYVRAAIEQATGERLPLPRIRELLVEQGLITQAQADRDARLFVGFTEFFNIVDAGTEHVSDREEGLPEEITFPEEKTDEIDP